MGDGVRAGDIIFQLEAFDQFGAPVSPLPAEVTLNVQYSNTDVAGLDETLFPRDVRYAWRIADQIFLRSLGKTTLPPAAILSKLARLVTRNKCKIVSARAH